MKFTFSAVTFFLIIFLRTGFSFSQSVFVVDFKGFEKFIDSQTSNVLVINFWATWCRPCIREMPVFQQIHNDYNDKNVKVILVSLDFTEHLETRVIPFIQNRKIESEVILLDDVDYNTWIDKVDVNWQGEIPFTWIIDRKNGKKYSHYGEITQEILVRSLNDIIQY